MRLPAEGAFDTQWALEERVMPTWSDGTSSHNHSFGGSVALLEGEAAPQLFVGAHGWAEYTGAVFVFQRRGNGIPRESDGRVWVPTQTLGAVGGATGDRFGLQVGELIYACLHKPSSGRC
jgi:hypothetical protein